MLFTSAAASFLPLSILTLLCTVILTLWYNLLMSTDSVLIIFNVISLIYFETSLPEPVEMVDWLRSNWSCVSSWDRALNFCSCFGAFFYCLLSLSICSSMTFSNIMANVTRLDSADNHYIGTKSEPCCIITCGHNEEPVQSHENKCKF